MNNDLIGLLAPLIPTPKYGIATNTRTIIHTIYNMDIHRFCEGKFISIIKGKVMNLFFWVMLIELETFFF